MSKKKSSYFKPNASQRESALQAVIQGELQRQRTAGLAQGAHAMCQVILEKAKDDTKSVEERLQDVIKFCNTCIGPGKDEEKGNTPNA